MVANGLTVGVVRLVLLAQPGLNKRDLLAAIEREGIRVGSTSDLNRFLYGHRDEFEPTDGPRGPHWSVRTVAAVAIRPASEHEPLRPTPAPSDGALDLYPWQVRALEAWRKSGSQGVVEAVTGAGKTRLALQAILDEVHAGHPSAVVVPTLDLVRQWEREIRRLVVPRAGRSLVIATLGAGHSNDLDSCDVLLATAASAARWELLTVDRPALLVADECHHYGADIWSRVLEPRFAMRLGLTATYEREDNGIEAWLDPYFGGCCYRVGYREALSDGVIAPFRIAFVGARMTDDEMSDYEEAAARAARYRGRLVREWKLPDEPFGTFIRAVQKLRTADVGEGSKIAGFYLSAFSKRRQIMAGSEAKMERIDGLSPAVRAAQRTIIFAQTVDASDAAIDRLRTLGHVGAVIEASMDEEERRNAFNAFERGDYSVVAAPRLLDEGVDVPAADLALVLASSRSRRQLIQRMGRVIRLKGDGRPARIAILYAEATAEDPVQGAHEDFLDEVLDVAEGVATFGSAVGSDEVVRYLDPRRAKEPRNARPSRPRNAARAIKRQEGPEADAGARIPSPDLLQQLLERFPVPPGIDPSARAPSASTSPPKRDPAAEIVDALKTRGFAVASIKSGGRQQGFYPGAESAMRALVEVLQASDRSLTDRRAMLQAAGWLRAWARQGRAVVHRGQAHANAAPIPSMAGLFLEIDNQERRMTDQLDRVERRSVTPTKHRSTGGGIDDWRDRD